MGQKSADTTAIPLCWQCHREGPNAYHKGVRAFCVFWDLAIEVWVSKLNEWYADPHYRSAAARMIAAWVTGRRRSRC